jgi:guanylate cyclase soluble subunit alpha
MPKEFNECLGKTCYFLEGYKHPAIADNLPIKDHIEAAMKQTTNAEQ